MKLMFEAKTDIGKKRESNEDSYGISADNKLFVACDGMGGHNAGEVASRTTVDTILTCFQRLDQEQIERICPDFSSDPTAGNGRKLVAAIRLANHRVKLMASENTDYLGMGTTIVTIYIGDGYIIAAHVGDSRIYRFRNDRLEQLTEDHTWAGGFVDAEPGANEGRKSNIITRAVGIEATIKIDLLFDQVETGDRFLLCSDGLSGAISNDEISQIIKESESASMAVKRLIDAANDHGGPDNITAVLVMIAEAKTAATPIERIQTTIKSESEEIKSAEDQIYRKLLGPSRITPMDLPQPLKPKRKRSNLLLYAMSIILSLAVIAVTLLLIFNNMGRNSVKTPPPTPDETSTGLTPKEVTPPIEEIKSTEGIVKLIAVERNDAMVYVDNRLKGKLGNLDNYQLRLAEGKHQIKIVIGSDTITKEIVIRRGKVYKLDIEHELSQLRTR